MPSNASSRFVSAARIEAAQVQTSTGEDPGSLPFAALVLARGRELIQGANPPPCVPGSRAALAVGARHARRQRKKSAAIRDLHLPAMSND